MKVFGIRGAAKADRHDVVALQPARRRADEASALLSLENGFNVGNREVASVRGYLRAPSLCAHSRKGFHAIRVGSLPSSQRGLGSFPVCLPPLFGRVAMARWILGPTLTRPLGLKARVLSSVSIGHGAVASDALIVRHEAQIMPVHTRSTAEVLRARSARRSPLRVVDLLRVMFLAVPTHAWQARAGSRGPRSKVSVLARLLGDVRGIAAIARGHASQVFAHLLSSFEPNRLIVTQAL